MVSVNYIPQHNQSVDIAFNQQCKLNAHATENNYWHYRNEDFDMEDRPMLMPNDSYGKNLFSDMYTSPGNDWEGAAPMYVANFVHKAKHPLFAVRWIQEGKKVITGAARGDIITWNTQAINSQNSQTSTVHSGTRVQSIAVS